MSVRVHEIMMSCVKSIFPLSYVLGRGSQDYLTLRPYSIFILTDVQSMNASILFGLHLPTYLVYSYMEMGTQEVMPAGSLLDPCFSQVAIQFPTIDMMNFGWSKEHVVTHIVNY